jgi:hypothetical protein
MLYPIARVQIRWLSWEEGGRRSPPSGPAYAATAHFTEDALDHLFSVVLRLAGEPPVNGGQAQEAGLTLLAPDNLPDVVRRLVPGCHLSITEGARAVGECQVLAVRHEESRSWQDALQTAL